MADRPTTHVELAKLFHVYCSWLSFQM